MKRLAIITASLLAVLSGWNMSAQTISKYGHGEDSLNCLKYLSFYTERFKKDEKDPMALSNWRQAYKYCPATASENIFVNGTKMMTNLYRNTKNAKQRVAIADTILMLQDQRLAAYPKKKTTILNNKGQYIINYKSSDVDFMYENLSGIMNELGKNTKSNILSALMQSAVAQYREEKLSADDIIALYEKVSGIIDQAQPRNEKETASLAEDKEKIESIFAASKVASCENLIAIFSPRFEADPENLGLVTKIVQLMNNADDCASNDLYLKAATAKYKLDPSHGSAFGLYRLNAARGNVADAGKYLQEAIDSPESDEATDAQYYYEMATFCYKNGLRARAYDAARKAADLDYGYAGKAYMIMGNLWASASCESTEAKWARYWAATDCYQKARSIDESLSEDAGSSIATVSRYFPEASEAFMYDLTKGQSYTVSCGGMTATTTVRVQ